MGTITLKNTDQPGLTGLPPSPHRLLGLSQSSTGRRGRWQDVEEREVNGPGGLCLPSAAAHLFTQQKFLYLGHLWKEEGGCPDRGRSLPLDMLVETGCYEGRYGLSEKALEVSLAADRTEQNH